VLRLNFFIGHLLSHSPMTFHAMGAMLSHLPMKFGAAVKFWDLGDFCAAVKFFMGNLLSHFPMNFLSLG